MAHLWVSDDASGWLVSPLDGSMFALGATPPRRLADLGGAPDDRHEADDDCGVVLHRVDDPSGTLWVILARREAQPLVNGTPSRLGLAVLDDRDEIRVPGVPPVFFSTEVLASVQPLPDAAALGHCPRCQQPLAVGHPAVRCPLCGLWHHETGDLPCWTYQPRCANPACAQATALDAGFTWTPEAL